MYIAVKHLHQTLAIVSILGFLLRFYWSVVDHDALQHKVTKILPHIIDTLLLVAAIVLMVIIQQYPFVNSWLTAKVVGLVFYIGFGVMCLKKAKTTLHKSLFAIAALSSFTYIILVAVKKTPWIF